MFGQCERCRKRIPEGKRFCKPCAVRIARDLKIFDDLPPEYEQDTEEVDLIAQYERRQMMHTWIGIGAILVMLVIAIWVLSGGA